ncbi:polar amino acid transport system substrate-binding protein [Natronospira proteinivora]|uniref:Polar amino acid transport system substrate-binding protein n=1 Tax=Natronospira proteinivora TaxID=1807133 RepID=A0ABT1G9M1_9GAMM|nr:transporter substrate-binding domain-containing protein [Natronospira proteinivora]MCP1728021.1 polar amino acid transport system substrate-binding protein [Natronospira proteinivora]
MRQASIHTLFWGACVLLLLSACEQAEPPAEETATDEAAPEAVSDCQLTMGWDPWEPYHYMTPKGEVDGLDVELVRAAAERMDCELDFVQDDFLTLLDGLRAGEIDLIPGATHTEARAQFAHFSDPYRVEYFTIWIRTDDQELLEGKDLTSLLESGRRVGFTEGFIYGSEVESLMADPEHEVLLRGARIGDLNLLRLIDHDIDAMIEDPYVATSIQRRLGFGEQVVRLEHELGRGDVHLMFSQSSVDEPLVERFNDVLAELEEDGTQDEIAARYQKP